ncbi:hypothetical protein DFP73DRAFT_480140, partial [Morchella snyderi]
ISRLDLSAYKNPILIDMAPGICTWSAALHDALKPRAHILLEPQKLYEPWVADFQSTRPNTYWLPEHGDRWALYMNMFGLDSPPAKWPKNYPNLMPRTVPPEDGVNTDLIFTGNISESDTLNNRLLAQLIATIPRERWLMTFGRVRFLMWIRDETKVRYIPRTVANRIRATVMAEAVCDVTEVVSSNTITTGRGHPKASVITTDADGNLMFEQAEHTPVVEQAERPPPPPPLVVAEGEEPPKRKRGRPEEMDFGTKQPLEKLIDRVEIGAKRGSRLKITSPLIVATLSALQELYCPTTQRIDPDTELAELRAFARTMQGKNLDEQHAHALSLILARLKEFDKNFKDSVRKLAARLTDYISDPATESSRIEGVEHPIWYYKDDLYALAERLIKKRKAGPATLGGTPASWVGRTMNAIKLDDSLIESLERPEETAAPAKAQGAKVEKMIADYNRNWDNTAQGGTKGNYCELKDDEIFSYETKLLEYHRREFEPITVQPNDFFPETPLALLDFTPKQLHPHLRNPDLSARDKTWETFNWLLRTLFLLRAHTISSALATLAPGGEHILDNLAPGVNINPDQRTRTLTANQVMEITHAWETWPFKIDLLHLEEYMGSKKDAEVMTHSNHVFKIKTLRLGRN